MRRTLTRPSADLSRSTGRGETGAAFTTIELLVVIGVLVLLLALAVPAFNYIMGNRSTQAAENMVSAMLGRARGYAMANQCYAGVAFFYNPSTERTTLAMVVQKMPGGAEAEDNYQNYKGWAANATDASPGGGGVNPSQYKAGDEVIAAVVDTYEHKVLVYNYYAKPPITSPPPAPPPNTNDNITNPNLPHSQTAAWGASMNSQGMSGFIDLITDTDLEPLPPGVGCQLVNSPTWGTNFNQDRYVKTGAIMFDQQGALACIPLFIDSGSQLAGLLQPNPIGRTSIPASARVYNTGQGNSFTSQLGVALYGREEFRGQGFDEKIPDDCLSVNAGSYTTVAPGASQSEAAQETWLDQNAQVLMISRYNGTLIRGE